MKPINLSNMSSFPLGVNILASKLVEQWLKIVKDETVPEKEIVPVNVVATIEETVSTVVPQITTVAESVTEVTVNTTVAEKEPSNSLEIPAQTFYKVTVRDGKQVIHKVETDTVDAAETNHVGEELETPVLEEVKEKKEVTEKKGSSSKDRSKHEKSRHRSSSSSSSKSNHSHSNSSSKEKVGGGSNISLKDKHRDKSKDRKHRDREHRSNGSVKSSSSIKDKEKQAEKDKATLAKIQPQSVDKLGRIPKKSSSINDKEKSKNDKKSNDATHKNKPSISIEVRKKGDGERPKTVKVFNSKLRSTGLEEAPKPPPSRQSVKKTPSLPSVMPVKRPSPSREAPPPPEKKIKLPEPEEKQDKPGGIKLIPPKPKRKYKLFVGIFSYMEIVFQNSLWIVKELVV